MISATFLQQQTQEQCFKENFPIKIFAPKNYRKDLTTLYNFAREADNIADNHTVTDSEAIRELQVWKTNLTKRTLSSNKWFNLYELIERKNLPIEELENLLEAFILDRTKDVVFQDHIDTLKYCRLSAIPVGRLIMALSRPEAPSSIQKIDRLCIGLQLLNFYQDVAFDWQVLSRQYIEQSDLDKAEISFKELFESPKSWLLLKPILLDKLGIYLRKDGLENLQSWDFFAQTLLTFNFTEKAISKLRLTESIFQHSKLKWYDLLTTFNFYFYDRCRLLLRHSL